MIARPAIHRTVFASLLVLALPGGVACGSDGGGSDVAADAFDAADADVPPDIETVDDAAQGDIGPTCPGGLGCPCTLFGDCNSGLCVESIERFQCATQCGLGEICPRGWGCYPIAVGAETIYGCVPRQPNVCRPCRSDEDCLPPSGPDGQDWLCIDRGSAGRFCGAPCKRNEDCPDAPVNFECGAIGKAGGGEALQCVPQGGECPCTEKFAENRFLTDCFVENGFGRCTGERTCDAPCDARTPATETCNGRDDDCNGNTDEGITSVPCLVTNSSGACPGTATCTAGRLDVCIGPQASPETCNGVDENCDGRTDEDFPDTDHDGLADCVDPDIDGDGRPNESDNCPLVANPDQANNDSAEEASGARIGDACDGDDDDDGIPDTADNCPLVKNIDQADTDLDGIGDACDCDADGDGVPNAAPLDLAGAACRVPTTPDNCRLVKNADQADTNGDKVGDACDCDVDGDGVMNNNPGCPPATPDNCRKVANPGQEDTDLDTTGDACDCDIDNDGIGNPNPGCPAVARPDDCPTVENADQRDTDTDGKGDACDCDLDGDTVPNPNPGCPACGGATQPACDNCPTVPNPGQENTAGTEFGDACSNDWDGDGVLNDDDNCPRTPNPRDLATGLQADLDLDGAGDACDCDIDADGFRNPGVDRTGASCPMPAPPDNCPMFGNVSQADLEHDGIGDACDCDIDGDGFGNLNPGCPAPVKPDLCPFDPLDLCTP